MFFDIFSKLNVLRQLSVRATNFITYINKEILNFT